MAVEYEPRAVVDKKKKERTANWHDTEIRKLLQGVEENKEALFAPLSQVWTSTKKKELWRMITTGIHSLGIGNPERGVIQVKKKWTNMRSTAISKARARKQNPTGFGPRESEEWWIEAVLDIVGRESATILGINPPGCMQESRLPCWEGGNHSDTSSQECADFSVIKVEQRCDGNDQYSRGDSQENTVLNHMTRPVQEYGILNNMTKPAQEYGILNNMPKPLPDYSYVMTDVNAPESHDDFDNDEYNEVSFQQTSTPKRALSLDSHQPILAKKVKTNAVGPKNGATLPTGSSPAAIGSTSSENISAIHKASTSAGSQVNRLRQLQHRKGDAAQSEKKGIEVMEMEMEKIQMEQEYFQEKLALARIHKTNAKLQQLKLYYEIKKLEDDQGVPIEKQCKNIVQLDFDPPE